jgi:hypothetical protein
MEFRVAQYHLAIEADSPDLALLAARQAEPGNRLDGAEIRQRTGADR